VVALRLEHLWLYLAAPILGAVAAVAVCRYVQPPGCCGDECPPVPAQRRVDWKIPDPRDMTPAEFRGVRDPIERKVQALLGELESDS
jgi:protein-tyrosine-phosphatase